MPDFLAAFSRAVGEGWTEGDGMYRHTIQSDLSPPQFGNSVILFFLYFVLCTYVPVGTGNWENSKRGIVQ